MSPVKVSPAQAAEAVNIVLTLAAMAAGASEIRVIGEALERIRQFGRDIKG